MQLKSNPVFNHHRHDPDTGLTRQSFGQWGRGERRGGMKGQLKPKIGGFRPFGYENTGEHFPAKSIFAAENKACHPAGICKDSTDFMQFTHEYAEKGRF